MSLREDIDFHNKEIAEYRPHWPEGPWNTEGDRFEFTHKGLSCLMTRHAHFGSWCGYVAVPKGHPYYEKNYDEVELEAHRGVNYAHECAGIVCHLADESEKAWWFGFDCGHGMDYVPNFDRPKESRMPFMIRQNQTYRTKEYVEAELRSLAEQLVHAGSGNKTEPL